MDTPYSSAPAAARLLRRRQFAHRFYYPAPRPARGRIHRRSRSRRVASEAPATASGPGTLRRPTLAYPLSIRVICRLVGLDLVRDQWLLEKLREVHSSATFAEIPRQWDVEAYHWSVLAKRLARPRQELLDALLSAWRDGTSEAPR